MHREVAAMHPPLVLDRAEHAAHIAKWSVLQRRVYDEFYRCYALISGVQSRDYLPDDILYAVIEPLINDYTTQRPYRNKARYDRVWPDLAFPRTIVRRLDGIDQATTSEPIDPVEWERRVRGEPAAVLKPAIHSGGGRDVRMFRSMDGRLRDRDGNELTHANAELWMEGDYVVQERIEQHPYFAALNESSLNTVRACTYRSVTSEEIVVLGFVVRMGRNGAEIDNQSAGGLCIHLSGDGRLTGGALSKYGDVSETAPSGQRIADLGPVPAFGEFQRTALEIASRLPDQRLLGVDLALDSHERVRPIEVNLRDIGVAVHQVTGHPIFGAYTDEVIDYCRERYTMRR